MNNNELEKLDEELHRIQTEISKHYRKKVEYDTYVNGLENNLMQLRKKKQKLEKSKKRAKVFCVLIIMFMIVLTVGCAIGIKLYVNWEQQRLYQTMSSEQVAKMQEIAMPLEKLRLENQNEVSQKLLSGEMEKMGLESLILSQSNFSEINEYISTLKRCSEKAVVEKQWEGEDYYLLTDKYMLDEYAIADPGNDTIFPGAILRGDSLFGTPGNYSIVSLNRNPMYLTCSQAGDNSILVSNPSYRTTADALFSFQEACKNKEAQEWSYHLIDITNTENLELSLGVSVKGIGLDMSSQTEKQMSTMAIVYKQIYYTVNAEPLNSAASYFVEGADVTQLGFYEPAYISSVDYGRMVIVFVSANMSSQELKTKLEASIKGVGIGAGISKIKNDNELFVDIKEFGGKNGELSTIMGDDESEGGLLNWWNEFLNGKNDTSDIERINEYIDMGEELMNPVPLSYTLKYLTDNAVVPTMIVENEKIIWNQDAKMVTVTLTGGETGTVAGQMSMIIPKECGMPVTNTTISIGKDGGTSGKISFIWDSSCKSPLEVIFDDGKNCNVLSVDLSEYENENSVLVGEKEAGLFSSEKETYMNIYISNDVEMNW